MAKTRTIGPRLESKIDSVISSVLELNNMEELQVLYNKELFQNPPDMWTDQEKALCDGTERKNLVNTIRIN